MEIFYVLTKYVQSRLLQNCRMRERVKLNVNLKRFSIFPSEDFKLVCCRYVVCWKGITYLISEISESLSQLLSFDKMEMEALHATWVTPIRCIVTVEKGSLCQRSIDKARSYIIETYPVHY